MSSRALDPKVILNQVCNETDPERLLRLIFELQQHRSVARGELRRLKTIIRNLRDSTPDGVRAELDRVYDLDHQFGKALRIAKTNLQFRGSLKSSRGRAVGC